MSTYLFIDNFIHRLESFQGLLLRDTNVLLLEWHGTETVVKEEQSFGRIHTQEAGNILVVGQCGAEANEANIFLRRLDVPDCSVSKSNVIHSC